MLRPYTTADDLHSLHSLQTLQNLLAQYPGFCVISALASICVWGIGISTR